MGGGGAEGSYLTYYDVIERLVFEIFHGAQVLYTCMSHEEATLLPKSTPQIFLGILDNRSSEASCIYLISINTNRTFSKPFPGFWLEHPRAHLGNVRETG